MVCAECRKFLRPRYKINKDGREQLFEHHRFQRSISGLKSTAASCGICQALAKKLPSEDPASLQAWKKIASLFSDDRASYTASLNEAYTLGTYRLSLMLNMFRDRRYSKPMLAETDQGVVCTLLLVPVTKSADICGDESSRQIASATSGASALNLAKDWLTECLLHHPLCQVASSPPGKSPKRFLPTRVIRILPQGIRLYTTTGTERDDFRYASLSHRWPLDSNSILQLTTDNIQQWHSGIEQNDDRFSTAFRDAIAVCRHLSIEYVWIDSLCILQSGDGGQDWQREAARMGEVYKYAIVNIAASSVVDGEQGLEEGFFRTRDPAFVLPSIVTASCDLDKQTRRDGVMGDLVNAARKGDAELTDYHVVPLNQFSDNVLDAPLNQRAWVMQERHLSPRILHFTSRQIFWECNETVCSETYPKSDPVELFQRATRTKAFLGRITADKLNLPEAAQPRLKDIPINAQNLWYALVARYSCGGLTKTRDKLIALSGVAREMAQCMGASEDDYVAGLWRHDILYGLLWKTPTIMGRGGSRVRPGKNEPYQAPSWSWASVNCPVTVNYRLHGTPHDVLAVVETVHVTPKLDPLGEILPGAYLRIRGTTYKARLRYVEYGGRIWPELSIGLLSKIQPWGKGSFAVLPDERFLDGDDRQRNDIRLLPMLQSKQKSTIQRQRSASQAWLVMLMLVPTGKAADEYERYGIVELRGNGSDSFLDLGKAGKMVSDPREETVTIV